MLSHFSEKFPAAIQENVAVDFMAMAMLMGNDYLPKFPGANLPKLWIRYQVLREERQPRRYLFQEDRIDMIFFLELMRPFGSVQLRHPPINFIQAHQRERAAAAVAAGAPPEVLNVSIGESEDDDEDEEADLIAAVSSEEPAASLEAAGAGDTASAADDSASLFADELGAVTTEDLWALYDPVDHVAECSLLSFPRPASQPCLTPLCFMSR